jgi:hypothetical protein
MLFAVFALIALAALARSIEFDPVAMAAGFAAR